MDDLTVFYSYESFVIGGDAAATAVDSTAAAAARSESDALFGWNIIGHNAKGTNHMTCAHCGGGA
jgi:hypothetical protein